MIKKMARIILIGLIAVLLLFLYLIIPKYEFENVISSDGNSNLTRIDLRSIKGSRTIFVNGEYSKRGIPEQKLEPIYMDGLTDGFLLYLTWENDTAVFYSTNSRKFDNTLPDKFKLIVLDGHNEMDMDLWFNIKNDSTNKYTKIFMK